MCVGLLKEKELIRAKAEGVGNPIMAVGARTGRDGIHGASFASEDLTSASEAKRPRIQVGDPFTEKLLLEASLELIGSGHIVAIQDMGAAGLTSSSAEMAERGDVGVTIDVTKVPTRETGMTPYEILLSESQERMLVVAKRGRERDVAAILEKWDLTSSVIGEVISEPVYRVTEGDRVVAEFPGSRLVTDCPRYTPAAQESAEIVEMRAVDPLSIKERAEERDAAWTLLQLLSSPTIASKAWAYNQYDSTVRTNTVIGPGGDAAVLRLRGTTRAIAVKVDGNGRYVHLSPRVGGRIAVAECARNVACTGARPLAITNCLNFGNPTKPSVYFQLKEAIAGIGEACAALGTPVTGGNVSLYNESSTGAVFPTPVIGMIGLIEDLKHVTRATFANAGDDIILLGECTTELGASEYLSRVHRLAVGEPPACDLAAESAVIEATLECIHAGLVHSAHDCSDGGLAVALAECCVANTKAMLGADVDLSAYADIPARALFFGEAQARVILSTSRADELLPLARKRGVRAEVIGRVSTADAGLTIAARTGRLSVNLKAMASAYHDAIPNLMSRAPNDGALIEHVTVASV